MKKRRWVGPKVAVDVAFVEWTEARRLRHALFAAVTD